jgi:hypothetical protein
MGAEENIDSTELFQPGVYRPKPFPNADAFVIFKIQQTATSAGSFRSGSPVDPAYITSSGAVAEDPGRSNSSVAVVHFSLIHVHAVRIWVFSFFERYNFEYMSIANILFQKNVVVRTANPHARRIPGQAEWPR